MINFLSRLPFQGDRDNHFGKSQFDHYTIHHCGYSKWLPENTVSERQTLKHYSQLSLIKQVS